MLRLAIDGCSVNVIQVVSTFYLLNQPLYYSFHILTSWVLDALRKFGNPM
jgi:hypothetical protein